MTIHFGRVPAGSVLPIIFGTYNGSGASVAATGLAVTDIEIYKGASVTQRASDAGYSLIDTDGLDIDGITGINGFSVDTGDNTDSGFYAVGSFFTVVVSAITVDSQTVSFVAATFSLGPAENIAGYPVVDAGALSGDTTAANNAESFFDGTGYAGTNNVIPTVTSVTNTVSANAVQISGDSVAADNLEAALDGTGGVTITAALTGNITGNLSGSVGSVSGAVGSVTGNVGGNVIGTIGGLTAAALADFFDTDSLTTYASAVAGSVVKEIADNAGGSSLTEAGIADAVWDEVLTAGTHNIGNSAGRRLRTLQTGGNYEGGLVWIDTNDGTAGTTLDENGVVTNPVDTLSDALTIAAAGNLKGFHLATGSSITLAATFSGYIVRGDNYTLALGGQDIAGTIFEAFGPVSGIATSSGAPPVFNGGPVGNVTLPPSVILNSGFTGTLTVGSAGDFLIADCHSQVAGTGTPTIDMGAAVGATTMSIRRWSGGLTFTNLGTGDVVSVDVISGGNINVNGTGGTIVIRGLCSVVDNSGGAVTITQTSVVNMTKINSEVDTAISDASLATAAQIAALNNLSEAQVNAQVVDVISADARAEPTSVPAANASLGAKLDYLFMRARNKREQTATKQTVYQDDGLTVFEEATVSDDGTTFTIGEFADP